jgi:hypothetical protein
MTFRSGNASSTSSSKMGSVYFVGCGTTYAMPMWIVSGTPSSLAFA